MSEKRAAKSGVASSLTLPVFFNAWRYEAEDHLILPLLKTAERADSLFRADRVMC